MTFKLGGKSLIAIVIIGGIAVAYVKKWPPLMRALGKPVPPHPGQGVPMPSMMPGGIMPGMQLGMPPIPPQLPTAPAPQASPPPVSNAAPTPTTPQTPCPDGVSQPNVYGICPGQSGYIPTNPTGSPSPAYPCPGGIAANPITGLCPGGQPPMSTALNPQFQYPYGVPGTTAPYPTTNTTPYPYSPLTTPPYQPPSPYPGYPSTYPSPYPTTPYPLPTSTYPGYVALAEANEAEAYPAEVVSHALTPGPPGDIPTTTVGGLTFAPSGVGSGPGIDIPLQDYAGTGASIPTGSIVGAGGGIFGGGISNITLGGAGNSVGLGPYGPVAVGGGVCPDGVTTPNSFGQCGNTNFLSYLAPPTYQYNPYQYQPYYYPHHFFEPPEATPDPCMSANCRPATQFSPAEWISIAGLGGFHNTQVLGTGSNCCEARENYCLSTTGAGCAANIYNPTGFGDYLPGPEWTGPGFGFGDQGFGFGGGEGFGGFDNFGGGGGLGNLGSEIQQDVQGALGRFGMGNPSFAFAAGEVDTGSGAPPSGGSLHPGGSMTGSGSGSSGQPSGGGGGGMGSGHPGGGTGHCVQTQMCMQGAHWDPQTCRCEGGGFGHPGEHWGSGHDPIHENPDRFFLHGDRIFDHRFGNYLPFNYSYYLWMLEHQPNMICMYFPQICQSPFGNPYPFFGQRPFYPGFDRFGFDRDGRDRFGFDRFGFDRDGFDRHGRDRYGRVPGTHQWGFHDPVSRGFGMGGSHGGGSLHPGGNMHHAMMGEVAGAYGYDNTDAFAFGDTEAEEAIAGA